MKKGIKIVQQIHNVVCQLYLNKAGGKYLGIKFSIRSLNQDIYWLIHIKYIYMLIVIHYNYSA